MYIYIYTSWNPETLQLYLATTRTPKCRLYEVTCNDEQAAADTQLIKAKGAAVARKVRATQRALLTISDRQCFKLVFRFQFSLKFIDSLFLVEVTKDTLTHANE
jgi:hypothetical protein